MLMIRHEQMNALGHDLLLRFEAEMVRHGEVFSPRLSEVIGKEQLRLAVASAIRRAGEYGFTQRGPVRLFIELGMLCGSAFDTDPQHRLLGDVLRAPGGQMSRAERMHGIFVEYLDTVCGADNANVTRALENLMLFARTEVMNFPDGFEAAMLRHIEAIFPRKAEYVGPSGMRQLMRHAVALARSVGFSTHRQDALVVALMMGFGHGCAHDPLYPWIGRTLTDPLVVDPGRRAERLERKALTWLRHVLEGPQARARA
jgi:hypothetical protein